MALQKDPELSISTEKTHELWIEESRYMFDDRHAKLTTTNGGFLLEFATKLSDGSTDEDYLELGWKKLVITDPPNVDPSLFVVSEDGYDETET